MHDPLDEDRQLREGLAPLGPVWLSELQFVLNAPEAYREDLRRHLIARPDLSDLAQLLAMASADKVVRMRLLRAIRDIEA
jgi:hypothetical protein